MAAVIRMTVPGSLALGATVSRGGDRGIGRPGPARKQNIMKLIQRTTVAVAAAVFFGFAAVSTATASSGPPARHAIAAMSSGIKVKATIAVGPGPGPMAANLDSREAG